MWIDAICIDQSNLKERSEQVRCMRLIYQKARRIVVWLGEADAQSTLAMDTLERLGPRQDNITRFCWPERK